MTGRLADRLRIGQLSDRRTKANRPADRLTDWPTDRLTEQTKDCSTVSPINPLTVGADRPIYGLTDLRSEQQTDFLLDWPTDRPTIWPTDQRREILKSKSGRFPTETVTNSPVTDRVRSYRRSCVCPSVALWTIADRGSIQRFWFHSVDTIAAAAAASVEKLPFSTTNRRTDARR